MCVCVCFDRYLMPESIKSLYRPKKEEQEKKKKHEEGRETKKKKKKKKKNRLVPLFFLSGVL